MREKARKKKKIMDERKIVVVVEDDDAARAALQWALHNIIRFGDVTILLHVYPSPGSASKKKARLCRLNGFRLALSFQDICNDFPNTRVEIIVTEGDREGMKIADTVREIGASILVVGLHDHSFLYKFAMAQNTIASNFNCRVLAIKQPPASMVPAAAVLDCSAILDFSQIDLSTLHVPDTRAPPKIPYRICPNLSAIIWRSRKSCRR